MVREGEGVAVATGVAEAGAVGAGAVEEARVVSSAPGEGDAVEAATVSPGAERLMRNQAPKLVATTASVTVAITAAVSPRLLLDSPAGFGGKEGDPAACAPTDGGATCAGSGCSLGWNPWSPWGCPAARPELGNATGAGVAGVGASGIGAAGGV